MTNFLGARTNAELMALHRRFEDAQELSDLAPVTAEMERRYRRGEGPYPLIRGTKVVLVERPAPDATVITAIQDDGTETYSLIVGTGNGSRHMTRAASVLRAYKRQIGRELDWTPPTAEGTWYRDYRDGNTFKSEWYLFRSPEHVHERARRYASREPLPSTIAVELHGAPFSYVYDGSEG